MSNLCMASRSQRLTAALAAQAGPVPVLPQRRHLLRCTHTHGGDSQHGNQLLYTDTCCMETPVCSPKYTVLLHLGQMFGPPEKDEKLAAERATRNLNNVKHNNNIGCGVQKF